MYSVNSLLEESKLLGSRLLDSSLLLETSLLESSLLESSLLKSSLLKSSLLLSYFTRVFTWISMEPLELPFLAVLVFWPEVRSWRSEQGGGGGGDIKHLTKQKFKWMLSTVFCSKTHSSRTKSYLYLYAV